MKLEIKIWHKDQIIFSQSFDSIVKTINAVNEFYIGLTGKERYNFDKTLFELLAISEFSDKLRGFGVNVSGNIYDSKNTFINIRVNSDILANPPQRVCAVILNDNYENMIDTSVSLIHHIVHTIKCNEHNAFSKIKEYILDKEYIYNVMDFDGSVRKILIDDRDSIIDIDKLENLARSNGVLIGYCKQYTKSFDYIERCKTPSDFE